MYQRLQNIENFQITESNQFIKGYTSNNHAKSTKITKFRQIFVFSTNSSNCKMQKKITKFAENLKIRYKITKFTKK